ncbi:MAG: hypothetical protein RLZZ501_2270 [Pseudomonadota bacterium]|jgi:nucleotide-binding universal stress UspA family protein
MKDILVHIDDSPRATVRLEIAIELTKRLDGRLTGLFARIESHRPSAVTHQASPALAAARANGESLFRARTAAAGIAARWWQLSHGEPGHVLSETMFCARFADLVVMGQPEPGRRVVPARLVEHVILQCGRPVLVIPHAGDFATVGERIAIAWNAGRGAVRALNDAKPLLRHARSVTVLSLRTPPHGDAALPFEVPQVDILDHLAINGIAAESERLAGEDIGKMDMLLSRACDLGADLVVMGTHGSEGLSLQRGRGTRFVLEQMTVPVLMSN